MSATVKITGLDKLQKHISQMQNPRQVFDDDFRRNAIESTYKLTESTPRKTGRTAGNWTRPKKVGLSSYTVENATATSDGRHSLAVILDQGRAEVRPVHAKKLYIPLSEKGASKKLGAKIPKDFVYGVDYVLANQSKAYPGTKYLQNEAKRCSSQLSKDMLATVRRIHGGQ